MSTLKIRFYAELNDFLPRDKRYLTINYSFYSRPAVKDVIESCRIPHTEVDLILANGESVDFDYKVKQNDYISVYPVFESFDVSETTKVRKSALRDCKFILDVHLGKLAKYLRMLGFDTHYQNDLDDLEIISLAEKESRTILTRDIGILKNNRVTHGYWIRSQNSKEQLKEVLQRFDLYNLIFPFTRCLRCNGSLKKVSKKSVAHKIPLQTKKSFSTFYQCQTCDKIYWKGSHFEKMHDFITNLEENS